MKDFIVVNRRTRKIVAEFGTREEAEAFRDGLTALGIAAWVAYELPRLDWHVDSPSITQAIIYLCAGGFTSELQARRVKSQDVV